MNAFDKDRMVKQLIDEINIYEQLYNKNPNDELTKDTLNFKKAQLTSLNATPTDEELYDENKFNNILIRQEEIVNGIDTNENKKIRNMVICFNSNAGKFEIKYQVDGVEKTKDCPYNTLFLKSCDEAYNRLIKQYGKKTAKEYDYILYGLFCEIDASIGTKIASEYLNNNDTFKVLYDFRNSELKGFDFRNIKKSYNKNKNKSNVYMIDEDTKEAQDFYNSVMTLPKVETVTEIKIDPIEESNYVEPVVLKSTREKNTVPEVDNVMSEEELDKKLENEPEQIHEIKIEVEEKPTINEEPILTKEELDKKLEENEKDIFAKNLENQEDLIIPKEEEIVPLNISVQEDKKEEKTGLNGNVIKVNMSLGRRSPETLNKYKSRLESLKSQEAEIEVIDDDKNNMSLNEILSDDDIEVLEDDTTKKM